MLFDIIEQVMMPSAGVSYLSKNTLILTTDIMIVKLGMIIHFMSFVSPQSERICRKLTWNLATYSF